MILSHLLVGVLQLQFQKHIRATQRHHNHRTSFDSECILNVTQSKSLGTAFCEQRSLLASNSLPLFFMLSITSVIPVELLQLAFTCDLICFLCFRDRLTCDRFGPEQDNSHLLLQSCFVVTKFRGITFRSVYVLRGVIPYKLKHNPPPAQTN